MASWERSDAGGAAEPSEDVEVLFDRRREGRTRSRSPSPGAQRAQHGGNRGSSDIWGTSGAAHGDRWAASARSSTDGAGWDSRAARYRDSGQPAPGSASWNGSADSRQGTRPYASMDAPPVQQGARWQSHAAPAARILPSGPRAGALTTWDARSSGNQGVSGGFEASHPGGTGSSSSRGSFLGSPAVAGPSNAPDAYSQAQVRTSGSLLGSAPTGPSMRWQGGAISASSGSFGAVGPGRFGAQSDGTHSNPEAVVVDESGDYRRPGSAASRQHRAGRQSHSYSGVSGKSAWAVETRPDAEVCRVLSLRRAAAAVSCPIPMQPAPASSEAEWAVWTGLAAKAVLQSRGLEWWMQPALSALITASPARSDASGSTAPLIVKPRLPDSAALRLEAMIAARLALRTAIDTGSAVEGCPGLEPVLRHLPASTTVQAIKAKRFGRAGRGGGHTDGVVYVTPSHPATMMSIAAGSGRRSSRDGAAVQIGSWVSPDTGLVDGDSGREIGVIVLRDIPAEVTPDDMVAALGGLIADTTTTTTAAAAAQPAVDTQSDRSAVVSRAALTLAKSVIGTNAQILTSTTATITTAHQSAGDTIAPFGVPLTVPRPRSILTTSPATPAPSLDATLSPDHMASCRSTIHRQADWTWSAVAIYATSSAAAAALSALVMPGSESSTSSSSSSKTPILTTPSAAAVGKQVSSGRIATPLRSLASLAESERRLSRAIRALKSAIALDTDLECDVAGVTEALALTSTSKQPSTVMAASDTLQAGRWSEVALATSPAAVEAAARAQRAHSKPRAAVITASTDAGDDDQVLSSSSSSSGVVVKTVRVGSADDEAEAAGNALEAAAQEALGSAGKACSSSDVERWRSPIWGYGKRLGVGSVAVSATLHMSGVAHHRPSSTRHTASVLSEDLSLDATTAGWILALCVVLDAEADILTHAAINQVPAALPTSTLASDGSGVLLGWISNGLIAASEAASTIASPHTAWLTSLASDPASASSCVTAALATVDTSSPASVCAAAAAYCRAVHGFDVWSGWECGSALTGGAIASNTSSLTNRGSFYRGAWYGYVLPGEAIRSLDSKAIKHTTTTTTPVTTARGLVTAANDDDEDHDHDDDDDDAAEAVPGLEADEDDDDHHDDVAAPMSDHHDQTTDANASSSSSSSSITSSSASKHVLTPATFAVGAVAIRRIVLAAARISANTSTSSSTSSFRTSLPDPGSVWQSLTHSRILSAPVAILASLPAIRKACLSFSCNITPINNVTRQLGEAATTVISAISAIETAGGAEALLHDFIAANTTAETAPLGQTADAGETFTRCGLCGKLFRANRFAAKHISRKHAADTAEAVQHRRVSVGKALWMRATMAIRQNLVSHGQDCVAPPHMPSGVDLHSTMASSAASSSSAAASGMASGLRPGRAAASAGMALPGLAPDLFVAEMARRGVDANVSERDGRRQEEDVRRSGAAIAAMATAAAAAEASAERMAAQAAVAAQAAARSVALYRDKDAPQGLAASVVEKPDYTRSFVDYALL